MRRKTVFTKKHVAGNTIPHAYFHKVSELVEVSNPGWDRIEQIPSWINEKKTSLFCNNWHRAAL